MEWMDKISKATFSTSKTARCFTYGQISKHTRHIWLLFHGYGQLATGVMKQFTNLDEKEHYVIAPEGLSRFYVKGVYGKVGASWMTKEDRELEIEDQFRYLDQVKERFIDPLRGPSARLHLLGFSQGVATLTRWLARDPLQPNSIIYWAGSVPTEDIPTDSTAFRNAAIYYLAGNQDPYIDQNQYKLMVEKISERVDKEIVAMQFAGEHRITADALDMLLAEIRKDA